MKKIIMTSIAVGVLASSSLSAAALSTNVLSGTYLSLGAGLMNLHQKIDYNVDPSPGNPEWKFSDEINQNVTPDFARFGIGYGQYIQNQYYVALELGYALPSNRNYTAKFNNVVNTADVQLTNKTRVNSEFEVNAVLGYQFVRHMLGFVKLGYSRLNTTNDLLFHNMNFPDDPWNTYNYKQHLNGVLLGIGLRFPVMQKLQLAAEYNYIYYGISNQNKDLTLIYNGTPVPNVSTKEKNRVFSNNVIVSLIYTI